MRQLFFALAFVLAACATPHASASDALEPDYKPLLESCLNAAADDEAFSACRGAASRPCIDDDGGTTSGVIFCYYQELEVWTGRMDSAVRFLNERFPDSAETIADAQHSWTAFRESECRYQIQMWGEGSGARVAYMHCMAEMTADRALTLMERQRHPG